MSRKQFRGPILSCNDGGDLYPREAEKHIRAYLALHNAVADDIARQEGRESADGRLRITGPMGFTQPPDVPDPDVLPRPRSRWRLREEQAPTMDGDLYLTLSGPPEVRVIACGTVADLVDAGHFSLVDAAAVWGPKWPACAVVLYRCGRGKRRSYASVFVKAYAPVGVKS